MSIKFFARNVPILNFSYKADRSGEVIPPECHFEIPKSVPILFGNSGLELPVGMAKVKRKGGMLLADMDLISEWASPDLALVGIKCLYPAIAGTIVDAHKSTILRMKLEFITLNLYGNADEAIQPIGDKLWFALAKDAN
jgi:hypothetical protein